MVRINGDEGAGEVLLCAERGEMNKVHYKSNSNEWETPQKLFDKYDNVYLFTLDPCCTHENAKCKKHYTIEDNGLAKSWEGERVFMNPPYGRGIGKWIKKAFAESIHATIVCLIPARTDTAYWHDYIFGHAEITFLRGRLYFKKPNGETGPAPFPSAVVIYRPKQERNA